MGTFAVMVVVLGLTQGTSPPVPAPAPVPRPHMYRPPYRPSPFGGFGGGIDPTTLLLLGGGLGGSSSSTDSLLPLLLLGGGGLGGGKHGMGGGLGGLGGVNPLMLSLLSCKEPVADCQKPNEGTTLCGKGAAKVCCTCNGGGLFGL